MGYVNTQITLKNVRDVLNANEGSIQKSEIRQATVDVMVDTGATLLVINKIPLLPSGYGILPPDARRVLILFTAFMYAITTTKSEITCRIANSGLFCNAINVTTLIHINEYKSHPAGLFFASR